MVVDNSTDSMMLLLLFLLWPQDLLGPIVPQRTTGLSAPHLGRKEAELLTWEA